MNGEILKVMDSPRNALKLVLIGQCNGSFLTYLYPQNQFLQFYPTLLRIPKRTSQSILGREFQNSTRTVQLCLL